VTFSDSVVKLSTAKMNTCLGDGTENVITVLIGTTRKTKIHLYNSKFGV
jgi:hypothetical protein